MLTTFHELVIIDLEVSDTDEARSVGLPPEMIDLGAYRLDRELSIIDQFSTLVRPYNLEFVTEQTTRITGITRPMLENAPMWKDVWPEFTQFTDFNNTLLGAFHAVHDHGWLRAAYQRARLGYPHRGFFFDVASAVYSFCSWYGIKPKSWSLKNVCARFDVPYGERNHRGLADAACAVAVIQQIQGILNALPTGRPVSAGTSG